MGKAAHDYRRFDARESEASMTETSQKELALQAVEQLPDDATLEDAMEQLYLLEKIERGREDIRLGRTVSHQDVQRRFGLR